MARTFSETVRAACAYTFHPAAEMTMARYEMVEDGHATFWEIERAGATVTVTCGRIGTSLVPRGKTDGRLRR